jgi:hypothetical protein
MKHIHENSHNQTKLGVRCERGLQPCAKIFRTFKGDRMTLWIIQSVIIVWIMEGNALHPGHEPNDTATSQEKP